MSLISRFGKEKADQLKKQNCLTYPSILFEMLDVRAGKPTLTISKQEQAFAQHFFGAHIPDKHPIIGLNTSAGNRVLQRRAKAARSMVPRIWPRAGTTRLLRYRLLLGGHR